MIVRRELVLAFILLTAGIFLQACQDDDSSAENDLSKKIVVEGYVYADEIINHIKISRVHDGGAATPVPVQTAQVKVKQGGVEYILSQDPEREGVYIQTDSTAVLNGFERVELDVVYDGLTYSSSSAMPEKIQNLAVSEEYLNIIPGNDVDTVAILSWDPVENATGYCVFIRQISASGDPINTEINAESNPFLIIHDHTQIALKGAHFDHFGEYLLYVTAVNSEYSDVYSGSGNSSSLDGAPSNIQNGWGVFTAFNGDSLSITVQ